MVQSYIITKIKENSTQYNKRYKLDLEINHEYKFYGFLDFIPKINDTIICITKLKKSKYNKEYYEFENGKVYLPINEQLLVLPKVLDLIFYFL